ncbi:F-box and leucine-rich repeat protein 13 [Nelusetta ayraudi]|uniref:F-box and leucine-rich repeat protein 13 n=1 Tax=Nelusetta ayraudi TaxID=303726 RepID=UPI003F719C8C
MANTKNGIDAPDMEHCLPKIYKTALAASCLSCPSDPVQFLKNTLVVFQGHDNLQNVDWYKFVAEIEDIYMDPSCPSRRSFNSDFDSEDMAMSYVQYEKANIFYTQYLIRFYFRTWKRYTAKSKTIKIETLVNMNLAMTHYETRMQKVGLCKWIRWVRRCKRRRAAGIQKLERLANAGRLKRIFAGWCDVARDSKRSKEYSKKLEPVVITEENVQRIEWVVKPFEGLKEFPDALLLKIFKYLQLRDWLTCADVCCEWKAIIQSGSLWSEINFSLEKDWITDSTAVKILRNYRPFVINLNLRGCSLLSWPSLKYICECKNLQELNLSQCDNVTDLMMQNIVDGCAGLLYLNLSCTLITDVTIRELSRSCINLQYLSLAYCYRVSEKGLTYLNTGKGCRNLIHLDLSGCNQITVSSFKCISDACRSLREIVINDMPTLSDECLSTLIARCHSLTSLSLMETPFLSDVSWNAIAGVAKLKSFSTRGNYQVSDDGWMSLCLSSRGLRTLHIPDCPKLTNSSLRVMANLKGLQHLDISYCSKVGDFGIQYLTKGLASTKLMELNLSHCSNINDSSVMKITQRCKLAYLNLSYCEKLTSACLEWIAGSSIRTLDLSGCNIGDEGLAAMEGTRLKKLVLAECIEITNNGIESLCKNVRELEYVDISYCMGLSDMAIRAISFYCRGLITLRMGGCSQMTDVAVQYLTIGSVYLRVLDLSGCILLTDDSAAYLVRLCPPLSSITMACCCNISKMAALTLQPHVEYWEHSNDDPIF